VTASRGRGYARRELAVAALLCAAGAGLVLAAAGRVWVRVTVTGAGTPLDQPLTGRDLAGAAVALGWAGLAGLAALVAVGGRARVVVGALLVAFGGGAGYASAAGIRRAHVLSVVADKNNFTAFLSTDLHVGGWWAVSLAGGVLLAAAGLLTVVRGGRWPGMSARYDPSGGRAGTADPAAPDPAHLWKSLDRGEDPTARDRENRSEELRCWHRFARPVGHASGFVRPHGARAWRRLAGEGVA
jgi:uncharacterized membrane protein (TIGR02234 family)